MRRDRWPRYYDAAPRREVEGGVVVTKPGKVTGMLAVEMVAAAEMESEPQILARGRTYARAGQVVAVQVEPRAFSAQIQGTSARPYEVRLDRTTISGADRVAADCTCPYGCDGGWCKHAAALAYVAAFLLERDPQVRTAWAGSAAEAADPADRALDEPAVIPATIADTAVVAASSLTLRAEELAALRSPIPLRDPAGLLDAAQAIVPLPYCRVLTSGRRVRPADRASGPGQRPGGSRRDRRPGSGPR